LTWMDMSSWSILGLQRNCRYMKSVVCRHCDICFSQCMCVKKHHSFS
jgi:hypothetical protein